MRPIQRILILLGMGAAFIASELLFFRSLNTSVGEFANAFGIVMQRADSLLTIASASSKLLNSHEGTKLNLLSKTNGVTKSGASWDRTTYETPTGARVRLTIVHLDSHKSAKKEYADWLKLKGVRVTSKGKVQDKSGATEDRAVVKFAVPIECDEGTAIFATAGTALRVIQSCSSKVAFEFENQTNGGERP